MRVRSHYRAHKIALWLQLIPELERTGEDDRRAHHHVFPNHDNKDLYSGIVRKVDDGGVIDKIVHPSPSNPHSLGVGVLNQSLVSTLASTPSPTRPTTHVNITHVGDYREHRDRTTTYSLTMYVTIGIGCSLLFLNILILLIICHQKNNKRSEAQFYQSSRHSSDNSDTLTRTCVTFADTYENRQEKCQSKGSSQSGPVDHINMTGVPVKSIYKHPNGSPHMLLSVPEPPKPPAQRQPMGNPESQPLLTSQPLHSTLKKDTERSRTPVIHEMRV